MRKKLFLISLISMLFISSLSAEDMPGKMIFEEKGCILCHKTDMDTVGPSLLTIANVYAGREAELLTYLKGQGRPIVDPSRASVMDPQLVKIRTMFEEDLHSLAIYITSANR